MPKDDLAARIQRETVSVLEASRLLGVSRPYARTLMVSGQLGPQIRTGLGVLLHRERVEAARVRRANLAAAREELRAAS